MTTKTPSQVFAELTGALVDEHDVTDVLARLLHHCLDLVGVDSAAFLVRTSTGSLDILGSTSHRTTELELYQAQQQEGPCIDAVDGARAVSALGRDALVAAWPHVGPVIVAAGWNSVHALPMRWRGGALGGLNLFSSSDAPLDDDRAAVAQAFADFAGLTLLQPAPLPEMVGQVTAALNGRVVVERAKGALAYRGDLEMEAAYDELRARAHRAGVTLTDAARAVLDEAAGG